MKKKFSDYLLKLFFSKINGLSILNIVDFFKFSSRNTEILID